jgi:DDE superfamily endonuclease/helix-turn-helix, Psq domain
METSKKEGNINLALRAIQKDSSLSVRRAADLYNVDRTTLGRRMNGSTPRRDSPPNSSKLTNLEEKVIIERIIDLDSRSCAPRINGVGAMANLLLATRGGKPVGINWPYRFIARHEELKTRQFRRYDYKRALCEDPDAINAWFCLIHNTVAKYSIVDDDIYNFDETGFQMGIISTGMVVTSSERVSNAKLIQPGNREWITAIQGVGATGFCLPPFIVVSGQNHLSTWYEDSPLPPDWMIATSLNGWTTNEIGLEWIRHFDKHTRPRTVGQKRLLVLDGHESHQSIEFDLYCKEKDIILLYMPPHSSHLLQPLDVGCFSSLKKAYGQEIEKKMRAGTSHISKEDFFPAFFNAFKKAMTTQNILGGFRGSGLMPYNPESVLSKLDVKLKTPTPPGTSSGNPDPWTSQTPTNANEAALQSTFLRDRISNHQGSSPTSILEGIDHLTKGTHIIIHRMALIEAENKILRETNDQLSRRRRAKKKHLRHSLAMSIGDGKEQIAQNEVDMQVKQETQQNSNRKPRVETRSRRCGACGKSGHNARTCQRVPSPVNEETSS